MALSLIIFVLLLFFINQKRKINGKILLELILASELVYIFGYTCELVSNVVSQKIFFNHFQYIGVVFIAPLWYLISIRFGNIENRWIKLEYLVFVIPVIVLIGNFTYMSNHYYYQSYIPSNDNSGLFVILFEKGVLYYIHGIFQAVLAVLSAVNYHSVYKKTSGVLKRQSAILMGMSLCGIFISAICLSTRYTSGFDSGAMLTGISAFILLYVLFKYEVFDLIPLAYVKVFESNDNPIIVLNDSKAIVIYNTAAFNVFDDKLEKYRRITKAFDDEPELLHALENNESCVIKRTVKGKQMYFAAKLIRLDEKNNEIVNEFGYLLTFTNVTEHINEVHMLENAAYVDPLTDVYNRRFFFEKAKKAMERAKNEGFIFSLIMIDVDKFKIINDNFGHLTGDFVLKKVCGVIQEQLSPQDIVARYGGEEFIILLPDSDFSTAMNAAEKICHSVQEKHFKYGEEEIEVTVSLGVFTPKFPLSGSEVIEDFIASADYCLYNAKNNGRNRIFGANGV